VEAIGCEEHIGGRDFLTQIRTCHHYIYDLA
jgi:hypothetical protein